MKVQNDNSMKVRFIPTPNLLFRNQKGFYNLKNFNEFAISKK